jgi:hypothetical protein
VISCLRRVLLVRVLAFFPHEYNGRERFSLFHVTTPTLYVVPTAHGDAPVLFIPWRLYPTASLGNPHWRMQPTLDPGMKDTTGQEPSYSCVLACLLVHSRRQGWQYTGEIEMTQCRALCDATRWPPGCPQPGHGLHGI